MSKINNDPITLDRYVGNDQIKQIITDNIAVCKQTGGAFPHTFIGGSSGCGKTTLAHAIALELGTHIEEVNCGASANVVTSLIKLPDGAILFLDEIHSLSMTVIESALYRYMDEGMLLMKYPDGRVEPFTLGRDITIMAATTEIDKIPTPLLNRFTLNLKLKPYDNSEMIQILKLATSNLTIDNAGYQALANATRYIPRHAMQYAKIIKNHAIRHNLTTLTETDILKALHNMGIDKHGLSTIDREYMWLLYHTYNNNPTGVKNIALMMGESESMLIEKETHLVKEGLIVRTARGRMLTPAGLRMAMEFNGNDL